MAGHPKPAASNFRIVQGADFHEDRVFLQPDSEIDPLDLTGYTIRAWFSRWPWGPRVYLDTEIVTPALGLVRLTAKATLTSRLCFPQYEYSVELTAADGVVTIPIRSRVKVENG